MITPRAANRNTGGFVSSATSTTGAPPIQAPRVGMRFARPTTIPRTSQNGIPTAHSPIVASTPTAADTMRRART